VADDAARLSLATEAWRTWCRALEATGVTALENSLTKDEVDLAEGLRYLGRVSHMTMFGATDDVDSKHPYFWPFLGPHVKLGGDNPQGLYLAAPLNPTDTFVVRGTRGSPRWFSAIIMRNPATAYPAGQAPIGEALYLPDLDVEADGTFEIVVSPERQPGNWIPSDPWTNQLLVRQFFGTPDDVEPMTLTIENVTEGDTLPDPLDLAWAVQAVTGAAARFRGAIPHLQSELVAKAGAKNRFATDIGDPTSAGGVPGGNAVTARWRLEPHEALLVRVTPPVPCAYWDVQVGNGWYETFDYRHHISGLTCDGAHVAADDSVTLVLSDRDPGTTNWLEAVQHREGHIAIRWQLTDGQLPIPETTVVDVASVQELTGLPRVGPDERARQRAHLRASFENRFRRW
jgi:hypothetical protein